MSTVTPKIELLVAQKIANDIVYRLHPYCECIDIAGSIRRKCNDVGDIEIICIPKMQVLLDLFENPIGTMRIAEWVTVVQDMGILIKGNVANGRYLKLILPGDVQLDLFVPEADDYYRQLMIRTGSVEFVKMMAYQWRVKGWCGSKNAGLRRLRDCVEKLGSDGKPHFICTNLEGERPPVWESELEVFKWLGAKWVEPEHRM